MFCHKCGTPTSDGAKYCGACGAELRNSAAGTVETANNTQDIHSVPAAKEPSSSFRSMAAKLPLKLLAIIVASACAAFAIGLGIAKAISGPTPNPGAALQESSDESHSAHASASGTADSGNPTDGRSSNAQSNSQHNATASTSNANTNNETSSSTASGASGSSAEETLSSNSDAPDATEATDAQEADAPAAAEPATLPEEEAQDPAESNAFRQRFEDIRSRKSSDARMAGSDAEMQQAANEYLAEYRSLLDEVYAYADSQPHVDSAELQSSQGQWETRKQQQLETAAWEFRGGSIAGVAGTTADMNWTEWRIDELLALLDSQPYDTGYRTSYTTYVDNDAYQLIIPDNWIEGTIEILSTENEAHTDFGQEPGGEELGMGYTTLLRISGGVFDRAVFHISCFKGWGFQGNFVVRELGEPSSLPGWRAAVATGAPNPNAGMYDPPDTSGLIDVFSQFIVVK